MKLTQKDTFTFVGYAIIIALLLVLLLRGNNVDCSCNSAKMARAPFHYIPNPSNMNNQKTTDLQQTLMNIQGCEQIGGLWKQRPGGTGVCQNWERLGPPLE